MREWRLLVDYDARLMRAYDALDWQRYAGLQRQLLAQLSRGCLAALDQQHTQDEAEPAPAGLAQPSAHGHGGAQYSVRGDAACEVHDCQAR